MKKAYIPLLIAASLSLSACVISIDDDGYETDYVGHHSSWQKAQKENRKHIARLSLGESKSSVVADMGEPDFNEALKKDDSAYQLLWYRTEHRKSDGITTKDECTPLVFKNDELIGWGETALSFL